MDKKSLLYPATSKKLAVCMNGNAFYALSRDEFKRWSDALLKAQTIQDLPQDILKKIGWN